MTRVISPACYLLALILAMFISTFAVTGSRLVVPVVLGMAAVIVILMLVSARIGRALRYQWPAVVLVALAAVGLAVLGLVMSFSIGTDLKGSFVEHICHSEQRFHTCQQTFQSRWATLKFGSEPNVYRIPIAAFGVVCFGSLLLWFVTIGRPLPQHRWRHLVPVILTGASVCVAAYLLVITFTRMAAPCPLCLTGHTVTGLLFIGTVLSWPRAKRWGSAQLEHRHNPRSQDAPSGPHGSIGTAMPLPGSDSWRWPITVVVLIAVFVTAELFGGATVIVSNLSNYYEKAYRKIAEDPAYMLWAFERETPVEWSVRPDDSIRGSKSAPFVAITYADFQCPHCRDLAETLDEVHRRFPDRIAVVFRHYPLDRTCNPLVDTYQHAFSCQAARATEAARRLGGDEAFWKMHDAIFAHQGELDSRPYAKLARQTGLDVERFLQTMEEPGIVNRIQTHLDIAEKLKIKQTPRVFLNGRSLTSWKPMAFWEALLKNPNTQPASKAATDPRNL